MSEAERLLVKLMEGVELTDEWSSGLGENGASAEMDYNVDSELDVHVGMSPENLAELDQKLLPLKQVLAKVWPRQYSRVTMTYPLLLDIFPDP